MMKTEFEQAMREFVEKHKFGYQEYVDFVAKEFNSLLEQHKEVILREELIKFGKTLRGWGIELPSDILECAADEHIEYPKNVKK